MDLIDFLKTAKDDVAYIDAFKEVHIVLGNSACDLDSAVSAILHAYYLSKVTSGEASIPVIPVLNIPKVDYPLRTEITPFLSSHKIREDLLTFRDSFDLNALAEDKRLRLTLVDHNVLSADDREDLDPCVVQIIDHHENGRGEEEEGREIEVHLEPVGSCVTLVAERILEKAGRLMNERIAALATGTILLDTVNLSREIGRMTDKDESVVEQLKQFCPDIVHQDVYESLQRSKFDVSGLSAMDIVRKDFKSVSLDGKTIGLSTIPCSLEALLEKSEVWDIFPTFSESRDLTALLLVAAYHGAEGTLERGLGIFSLDGEVRRDLVRHFTSKAAGLHLERKSHSFINFVHFYQGNVKASRKVILPLAQRFLEHGPEADPFEPLAEGEIVDHVGKDRMADGESDSVKESQVDTSANLGDSDLASLMPATNHAAHAPSSLHVGNTNNSNPFISSSFGSTHSLSEHEEQLIIGSAITSHNDINLASGMEDTNPSNPFSLDPFAPSSFSSAQSQPLTSLGFEDLFGFDPLVPTESADKPSPDGGNQLDPWGTSDPSFDPFPPESNGEDGDLLDIDWSKDADDSQKQKESQVEDMPGFSDNFAGSLMSTTDSEGQHPLTGFNASDHYTQVNDSESNNLQPIDASVDPDNPVSAEAEQSLPDLSKDRFEEANMESSHMDQHADSLITTTTFEEQHPPTGFNGSDHYTQVENSGESNNLQPLDASVDPDHPVSAEAEQSLPDLSKENFEEADMESHRIDEPADSSMTTTTFEKQHPPTGSNESVRYTQVEGSGEGDNIQPLDASVDPDHPVSAEAEKSLLDLSQDNFEGVNMESHRMDQAVSSDDLTATTEDQPASSADFELMPEWNEGAESVGSTDDLVESGLGEAHGGNAEVGYTTGIPKERYTEDQPASSDHFEVMPGENGEAESVGTADNLTDSIGSEDAKGEYTEVTDINQEVKYTTGTSEERCIEDQPASSDDSEVTPEEDGKAESLEFSDDNVSSVGSDFADAEHDAVTDINEDDSNDIGTPEDYHRVDEPKSSDDLNVMPNGSSPGKTLGFLNNYIDYVISECLEAEYAAVSDNEGESIQVSETTTERFSTDELSSSDDSEVMEGNSDGENLESSRSLISNSSEEIRDAGSIGVSNDVLDSVDSEGEYPAVNDIDKGGIQIIETFQKGFGMDELVPSNLVEEVSPNLFDSVHSDSVEVKQPAIDDVTEPSEEISTIDGSVSLDDLKITLENVIEVKSPGLSDDLIDSGSAGIEEVEVNMTGAGFSDNSIDSIHPENTEAEIKFNEDVIQTTEAPRDSRCMAEPESSEDVMITSIGIGQADNFSDDFMGSVRPETAEVGMDEAEYVADNSVDYIHSEDAEAGMNSIEDNIQATRAPEDASSMTEPGSSDDVMATSGGISRANNFEFSDDFGGPVSLEKAEVEDAKVGIDEAEYLADNSVDYICSEDAEAEMNSIEDNIQATRAPEDGSSMTEPGSSVDVMATSGGISQANNFEFSDDFAEPVSPETAEVEDAEIGMDEAEYVGFSDDSVDSFSPEDAEAEIISNEGNIQATCAPEDASCMTEHESSDDALVTSGGICQGDNLEFSEDFAGPVSPETAEVEDNLVDIDEGNIGASVIPKEYSSIDQDEDNAQVDGTVGDEPLSADDAGVAHGEGSKWDNRGFSDLVNSHMMEATVESNAADDITPNNSLDFGESPVLTEGDELPERVDDSPQLISPTLPVLEVEAWNRDEVSATDTPNNSPNISLNPPRFDEAQLSEKVGELHESRRRDSLQEVDEDGDNFTGDIPSLNEHEVAATTTPNNTPDVCSNMTPFEGEQLLGKVNHLYDTRSESYELLEPQERNLEYDNEVSEVDLLDAGENDKTMEININTAALPEGKEASLSWNDKKSNSIQATSVNDEEKVKEMDRQNSPEVPVSVSPQEDSQDLEHSEGADTVPPLPVADQSSFFEEHLSREVDKISGSNPASDTSDHGSNEDDDFSITSTEEASYIVDIINSFDEESDQSGDDSMIENSDSLPEDTVPLSGMNGEIDQEFKTSGNSSAGGRYLQEDQVEESSEVEFDGAEEETEIPDENSNMAQEITASLQMSSSGDYPYLDSEDERSDGTRMSQVPVIVVSRSGPIVDDSDASNDDDIADETMGEIQQSCSQEKVDGMTNAYFDEEDEKEEETGAEDKIMVSVKQDHLKMDRAAEPNAKDGDISDEMKGTDSLEEEEKNRANLEQNKDLSSSKNERDIHDAERRSGRSQSNDEVALSSSDHINEEEKPVDGLVDHHESDFTDQFQFDVRDLQEKLTYDEEQMVPPESSRVLEHPAHVHEVDHHESDFGNAYQFDITESNNFMTGEPLYLSGSDDELSIASDHRLSYDITDSDVGTGDPVVISQDTEMSSIPHGSFGNPVYEEVVDSDLSNDDSRIVTDDTEKHSSSSGLPENQVLEEVISPVQSDLSESGVDLSPKQDYDASHRTPRPCSLSLSDMSINSSKGSGMVLSHTDTPAIVSPGRASLTSSFSHDGYLMSPDYGDEDDTPTPVSDGRSLDDEVNLNEYKRLPVDPELALNVSRGWVSTQSMREAMLRSEEAKEDAETTPQSEGALVQESTEETETSAPPRTDGGAERGEAEGAEEDDMDNISIKISRKDPPTVPPQVREGEQEEGATRGRLDTLVSDTSIGDLDYEDDDEEDEADREAKGAYSGAADSPNRKRLSVGLSLDRASVDTEILDQAYPTVMTPTSNDMPWDDDSRVRQKAERVSPIPEYSARDEYNDRWRWRRVKIGDKEHTIDNLVIEPYKKVLSHGEKSRLDYDYVMHNLFLYVVSSLDLLVAQDYMIIYFHGAAPRTKIPSLGWMKKCYQMIDRRLKKNLKGLFIVHPTPWLKTVMTFTRPFVSAKFFRKLKFVHRLSDLAGQVSMEYIFVPEEVSKYDDARKEKPTAPTSEMKDPKREEIPSVTAQVRHSSRRRRRNPHPEADQSYMSSDLDDLSDIGEEGGSGGSSRRGSFSGSLGFFEDDFLAFAESHQPCSIEEYLRQQEDLFEKLRAEAEEEYDLEEPEPLT